VTGRAPSPARVALALCVGRALIALATIAAAFPLPACTPSRATTPVTPVYSRTTTVHAVIGGRLVLPIDVTEITPRRGLQAELNDGVAARALTVQLYRIVVTVPADDLSTADRWLPPPGEWTTIPFDDSTATVPRGRWVAVIDMPSDVPAAPGSTTLLLNGKPRPVSWLPSQGLLERLDRSTGEDPWQPTLPPEARGDPTIIPRIQAEAMSPVSRWRYRLLIDGLRWTPADDPDTNVSFALFRDPVIEALAKQNEDRWRIALAWLWNADADAASRLKRRLSAVIDFGQGRFAPAWPSDYSTLDALLFGLLDPTLPPRDRKQLVDLWLHDQPASLAWTVDDGGTVDAATGTIIPSVGLVNFSDRPTLAWAQHQGAIGPATLVPLSAFSSMTLLVPPLPTDSGMPAPDGSLAPAVVAHVGESESSLPVFNSRVPVTPPGLSISSFWIDLTMQDWMAARQARPRPEWSTAVLLHRPALPPNAVPPGSESRRWELLVECRAPAKIGDPQREAVRLYVGPLNQPIAVLKIDAQGVVTDALPRHPMVAEELGLPPGAVHVTREADRWTFRIALPPGSIEADGLLRLGLTRTDALGRRSAWPRPMLPSQYEPARAALDTSAWTGLPREAP
jgi:hypothetical protein